MQPDTSIRISSHGAHAFCDHAASSGEIEDSFDSLRQILRRYGALGFTDVAVTEHLPLYEVPLTDKFLYDDERAKGRTPEFILERFQAYRNGWWALHNEFDSSFSLRLGFETEYYGDNPRNRLREAIKRYNPEIIVASVHHVDNCPIDFNQTLYDEAARLAGGLDKLYRRYYDHQLELIELLGGYTSQIPVVLGHMDLIKIFSQDKAHWSKEIEGLVLRNILAAKRCGLVFEINSRAFKKGLGEPYPSKRIIELINACHGNFTVGDDSHAPEQVGLFYPETEDFISKLVPKIVSFSKEQDGGYTLKEHTLTANQGES